MKVSEMDIHQLILDFIRAAGGEKQAGKLLGKSRQSVGHWSREYSAPDRFSLLEVLQVLREKRHPRYSALSLRACERLLGCSLKSIQLLMHSFEVSAAPTSPLSERVREAMAAQQAGGDGEGVKKAV